MDVKQVTNGKQTVLELIITAETQVHHKVRYFVIQLILVQFLKFVILLQLRYPIIMLLV